ncbi:hypothetical protein B1A99_31940 [Cohnella sp. CIP 111063]|uniref:hypothetical protein n=1 Tax=unclassified Cohnella TaxID=2636738 RepID=UPI000B8C439B|nr:MULTISPECIES: hypothetical protein [unclassified Cohnella]OXS52964.1 hypothetical protein B1A99_31940 [Cohnella sp. CIP 111063]PRX60221.1 hypothetical protein B0G52_12975 [Cohnella sp. SGD-V74]
MVNPSVIDKCVGRKVDLIYVDTSGKFTMRRVDLFSVRNGKARVYDVRKRGFRTLVVDRILAVQTCSSAGS